MTSREIKEIQKDLKPDRERERDSSIKSKDDMKTSRSGLEESTKPVSTEPEVSGMVRRKTPVITMDKIKNSRRGAETLDIKDLKEIHSTYTRRNLLDATKVHDKPPQNSQIHESKMQETKIHDLTTIHHAGSGLSPINSKKARETNKSSPGGHFAKIVMEVTKKDHTEEVKSKFFPII